MRFMGSTWKRSHKLLLTAATVAAMLFPGLVKADDNITLDFRDTDIRQIIKVIAQQSGTNIIAEKSVRGSVTVKMSDVYYEEAMNLIAKTNGFAVRKIGNTWILATEKILADSFEKGLTITKRLQYAKAADVSKIITATVKKDVKVATDDRINAVIVAGSKDVLEEVKKLIETVDTPVHQVMMEAKIVEVTTSAAKKIGFSWTAGNGGDNSLTDFESGVAAFSTKEYFAANPDSGLYQQQFTGQQGKMFGLGDFYRDSLLFKATIKCLERRSETKILSNPKISAVNGQEANVVVGTKVIYPGGADQPPREKDTGIKLVITPRINDDGYITVDAEPEVSVVEEWHGNYPIIGTRSAKTTVRVRDGEEILVGGMIRDTEGRSNLGIPILNKIPLVKHLFTDKSREGTSQELIILITPHIIAQSIESAAPTSLVPETPMTNNYPAATAQPTGSIDESFDNAFDTSF